LSVTGVSGATPLPPGSERRTEAERAGLAFERMLLVQLTQQLAKTAEGEESTSAASKAYRDLLPGVMADAMVAGGGIGLAASLTDAVPGAPASPGGAAAGGAEAPGA
jgi:Rod binding domain-containing protein